jgi:hypothetical protein
MVVSTGVLVEVMDRSMDRLDMVGFIRGSWVP